MPTEIMKMLWPMAGVVLGGIVGVSFGLVQQAAWRRHQKLEQSGQFNSGWAVIPGSMRRVAYLLVALVLVQLLCPLLFSDGVQWWVSGGVVAGYGLMLYTHLRQRLAQQPH